MEKFNAMAAKNEKDDYYKQIETVQTDDYLQMYLFFDGGLTA